MQSAEALPLIDFIECESVDIMLKTAFRGRCFMTHATKAIYRMLIGDFIKIAKFGGNESKQALFTEDDLERTMEKIECIDYHEQKEVNGIRFWCYVAGHVLGASMFMIEIDN
uniref:Lactamase_B domain-containing protein n=1 Tax=Steinernema glaseri TaxID=37863 RepID=A0A1I7Y2D0_9BILA